jgi:hypothetical protein
VTSLFSESFRQKKQACVRVVRDLIFQKRGCLISDEKIQQFLSSIQNIINELYAFQDDQIFTVCETSYYNVVRPSDFNNQLISTLFWKIIEELLDRPTQQTIQRFHDRYFQEYLTKLPAELDLSLLQTQINVHFNYSHMENNQRLIQKELASSLILSVIFDENAPADVVFTDLLVVREPGVLYFIDNVPLTLSRWQYIEQKILNYVKSLPE